MIYRDKITVTMERDTGQTDDFGNPLIEHVEATVRATVWPLGTEAGLTSDRSAVRTRYRMILEPSLDIPAGIGNGMIVAWRDYPQMYVDGSVERHYAGSRLHHYELITQAIVG